jgi:predicted SAM-dependent methyltransferase
MTHPGLHLVVQLYGQAGSEPHERMLKCISENSKLDFVKKITVVWESANKTSNNKKIVIVPSQSRASYTDLLKFSQHMRDETITHIAVANTDILLSEDVLRVMKRITRNSSAAAVSRTEMTGDLCQNPKLSQDLWIFKKHRFTPKLLDRCDYQLGVAGCENLFAMALYSHGYNIWNPCLDCKVIHNDPAPKREWSDRYYGSYLFLPPCKVEEVDTTSPKYEGSHIRQNFELTHNPAVHFFEKDSIVRLHLCCGEKKLPGFLGVDVRAEVNPDIVATVDRLYMIDDARAEEIYFCHGLEHIPADSAERCLLELHRVLIKGGTLRLAMPDFESLSKLYISGFVDLERIRPAIHGAQDYEQNTHYSSWDFTSLAKILNKCGFENVSRYKARDFLPKGFFDWSLHNLNGIETSLNVVCRKA